MFFEEDPSPECRDILFDKLPDKNLKYVCKTRKLLKMERTYVKPKEGTGMITLCYLISTFYINILIIIKKLLIVPSNKICCLSNFIQ